MPKKTRKSRTNNIKIGILFSTLIVLLIAFSIIGKMVYVFGQSKYDDSYPFSLKINSEKSVQLLSIYPKQNKIVLLNISDPKKDEDLLAIMPYEGLVSKAQKEVNPGDIPSFFLSLINGKADANLTIVDMLRMYLFSKTVSQDDILVSDISSLSEAEIDKAVLISFTDPTIISEDLRIEVVNATGVYGVGNNMAKLLTSLGANVIFVSTADDVEKNSIIYYTDDKNYTVRRFERVLGFETVVNKQKAISDVTVRIGQDSLKSKNP